MRKINVKKKITFLSLFYERPISIFPKKDSSVEGFPLKKTRNRENEIFKMNPRSSVDAKKMSDEICNTTMDAQQVDHDSDYNESILRIEIDA